jgi:hypothetical protein
LEEYIGEEANFRGDRCVQGAAQRSVAAGRNSFSVVNNQRGIAALVKRLKKLQVTRVVLKASCGYEVAVW